MSDHDAGEREAQAMEGQTPRRARGRRSLTLAVFIVATSVSLLLFIGALAANWVTARALREEISLLQRSSREPMGALFAVIQTSWEYFASPGDQVVYGRFSETLARLPDPFASTASRVATAGESMRKGASAGAGGRSHGSAARELAVALNGLARDGFSLTERENEKVLSAIQRHQERAMRLTWAGLLLGFLVAVTGLAYVRRIEVVNASQYEELLSEREKLKSLSARLLAAQEQERRAVARELHDSIGQSLGVLVMDATRAGALAGPEDEQLKAVVENIRQTADQLLQSVRDLALGLRPSMLDDLGLPAALDWLARETSRRSNVEVDLTMVGLDGPLAERYSTCIYRVVQEGLTNAARHAAARNIHVDVQRSGSKVRIEVRDDGRGFDPKLKQGLGLIGAAERLAGLGGELRIESRPGSGTRFIAELTVSGDEG